MAFWEERKLCAHPRLEIYKGSQIYFICPLARQGDFYVPEMKELEKKSRVAAADAEDAQTDITGTRESEGACCYEIPNEISSSQC
ncbi:hypothetical protein EYD10_04337 [Varanus komodoensis]|nr:hypothetical protein EYD10_04337 [Varanus komodoensis]